MYLKGEVYGCQLIDTDGEQMDACYGFYGNDPVKNGMMDNFEEKYRIELKEEVCHA